MLQAVLSDCNAFITEALPEPRVLPVLLRTTVPNHQQQLGPAARLLFSSLSVRRGDVCGRRFFRTEMKRCGRGLVCSGVPADKGWISAADANAANVPLGHIAT